MMVRSQCGNDRLMETSCNDRFRAFRPYGHVRISATVTPRAIRTELGLKMTQPVSEESMATLGAQLGFRGIDRRKFMQYSATITAMLALPPALATQVASALTAVDKPQLVWLNFQDCAGNSEALLRARDPDVATIILDLLSVDYMEVIMTASGHQAEAAKEAVLAKGGHIVVVEGSIPLNEDGIYCTIAGKTAIQILDEATKNCAAVLAIGTCATYGGLPAAKPGCGVSRFGQPMMHRVHQQLPPLRVVQQVVLQIGVALHHPDVAQHFVQHARRAAGAALARSRCSTSHAGAPSSRITISRSENEV